MAKKNKIDWKKVWGQFDKWQNTTNTCASIHSYYKAQQIKIQHFVEKQLREIEGEK